MQEITLRVDDEFRPIGSGVRRLGIISIGRRWVRLNEVAKLKRGARAVRIPRKVWDKVVAANQ